MYFSNNPKYGYGRTFNNLILCDTVFLKKGNSLIHEMLHTILPTKYENNRDGDFLMNESLIEYLAIYLTYKENRHLLYDKFNLIDTSFFYDTVGIKSVSDYYKKKITLYNIPENSNSVIQHVIYYKGPSLIYKYLSKKIGPEQFEDILISFYNTYLNKNDYVSYTTFLNFLSSAGVSADIIYNFDYAVKNICY